MDDQPIQAQETRQDDKHPDEGTDITDVIKRAVMEPEFREMLLNSPDQALAEYHLSDVQTLMVKNMRREDLEKLTPENLEEFFSSDAAVYTPDEIDVGEFEAYNIEDFGAEFEPDIEPGSGPK